MRDYNIWQMRGFARKEVDAATGKLMDKIANLEMRLEENLRQLKEKDATIKTLHAEIATLKSGTSKICH